MAAGCMSLCGKRWPNLVRPADIASVRHCLRTVAKRERPRITGVSRYRALQQKPNSTRSIWLDHALCQRLKQHPPDWTSPKHNEVERANHSGQPEGAFEFIQFATIKEWMRRSLERGNTPPRISVLNDLTHFGWAPVLAQALKMAELEPREPVWPSMELQLRSGISNGLLGQKTAKAALDAVAADWQRSMRRAGIKQG
jgi:hypothetical protein